MKVLLSRQERELLKNCPMEVPDGMLTEEWAEHNHGQSLARLNERGGLGIAEILANIQKQRRFDGKDTQVKVDELNKLIEQYCAEGQILNKNNNENRN